MTREVKLINIKLTDAFHCYQTNNKGNALSQKFTDLRCLITLGFLFKLSYPLRQSKLITPGFRWLWARSENIVRSLIAAFAGYRPLELREKKTSIMLDNTLASHQVLKIASYDRNRTCDNLISILNWKRPKPKPKPVESTSDFRPNFYINLYILLTLQHLTRCRFRLLITDNISLLHQGREYNSTK